MKRAFLLGLFSLASLVAAPALVRAQTVAVGVVRGPGAQPIRRQLAEGLSEAGFSVPPLRRSSAGTVAAIRRRVEADLFVFGRARRPRGQWSVTFALFGPEGEEIAQASGQARGRGGAVRAALADLVGLIRAAAQPQGEPESVDEPSAAEPSADAGGPRETDGHAGDDTGDATEDDDPAPAVAGAEQHYTALEIGASFVMVSRTLSYTDDIYGFLRGYELPLGPGFGLDARWYPGAHFGGAWYAHLGLDVDYAQSLGLESRRSDNVAFPTTFRRWYVGLRGRIPILDHEASLAVGYGSHAFLIEPSGAATAGRNVSAEVPSVDYQHLRFELETRWVLFKGLWLGAYFSYNYVLDAGGIGEDAWFPYLDVGSLRAGGSLHYTFDFGLDVGVWGEYWRSWFTLNPDGFNANWIAGGALDQYGVYGVRIGYRR